MIRKTGGTRDARNMTPDFLHKVRWNHFLTHPKVRKRRISPWNNKKQIKVCHSVSTTSSRVNRDFVTATFV